MAATSYVYAMTAFLNDAVAIDRLTLEIRQSSITVALGGIGVDDGNCTITFKAVLTAPEVTVLDGIVAAHTGLVLPDPVNTEGVPYVALYGDANKVQEIGRKGEVIVRASHNFCDPTSWATESVRVQNEVLSVDTVADPLPPYTVYKSVNKNWINILHPQQLNSKELFDAGKVVTGDQWGYLPQIRVGGVLLSPRPQWATNWDHGGDYYIDYEDGQIFFQSAPGSAPQATYHYAYGSGWCLTPKAGRRIDIDLTKAQWTSDDLVFNHAIVQEFQVYIGSAWIPAETRWYSSAVEMFAEARDTDEMDAVTGSPSWRGTGGEKLQSMNFTYKAVRELSSALNIRLMLYLADISLDKDGNLIVTKYNANPSTPGGGFGGTHASATVYGVSVVE